MALPTAMPHAATGPVPGHALQAAGAGTLTRLDAPCAARPDETDARLARFAVRALIEEAQLTPKPALVDRRGSGAHRDLDLTTMLRSANALEPTFAALARAARRRAPCAALRAELAHIGRAGEQAMMHATGGSNAHRGAIWIVGLLVAGAAIFESVPASFKAGGFMTNPDDCRITHAPVVAMTAPPIHARPAAGSTAADRLLLATQICDLGAQIARFPDCHAPPIDSHGERVRQRYGVGGARVEAQDGFPHLIGAGLPALLRARASGIAEEPARVDALLAIMASLDDTCLLHRAGMAGLHASKQGARRVLDCGGSSTATGKAALGTLEHALLSLNASPGGAADLLAATLFIDMLARHHASGSTASWNI